MTAHAPRARGPALAMTVATIALLVVALARGALLVSATPLLAVANNYDMIRVQGCIDAYPMRDAAIPPASNSPEAPIERYTFRDDVRPGCYWTSAALFAYAALPVFRAEAAQHPAGAFSIRRVGYLGLLATLAVAAAYSFAWWRRGRPGAALFNAAIVALLVADPANTLYLSTFYAEYAALFWGYVVLGGAALALDPARPAGPIGLALLALAMVALAMSKIQHAATGFMIAAVIAVLWRVDRRVPGRTVVAIALGGVIGLVAQVVHLRQPDMTSMAHANITNTMFTAVLGQSRDPVATARALGLPDACAQYAGKSWFSPGMQAAHACPEIFAMSRARLVTLAWREPALLLRIAREAMQRTTPWLPWLGTVEGGHWSPLPARFASLGRVLDPMPAPLRLAAFLLPIPLLAWVLVDARRAARRSPRACDDVSLHATLATCALLPLPMLAIIVFGDGFADTAKQAHLVTNLVIAFWLGFAAWLVARWRHGAPPPRSLA